MTQIINIHILQILNLMGFVVIQLYHTNVIELNSEWNLFISTKIPLKMNLVGKIRKVTTSLVFVSVSTL